MLKKFFSRLSVLFWVVLLCAGGVLMVLELLIMLSLAAVG